MQAARTKPKTAISATAFIADNQNYDKIPQDMNHPPPARETFGLTRNRA
jgi:hypothetical protein